MNPNQQPTMPQQQQQGQQFTSGHNQIYDKLRGVLLNLHAQGVPGMDKVLNALHQTHVSQLKPPIMPQQQGQQPNPLLGAAAGAQGVVENPPKFTFANNMNPMMSQAINADQVQGLLNTPSDSLQSAGALGKDLRTPNTSPQKYVQDAWGATSFPLMLSGIAGIARGEAGAEVAAQMENFNADMPLGKSFTTSAARALSSDSQKAQKFFGTTTNPSEAGYMTTDGKMLDFSGRNQAVGYKKGIPRSGEPDYLANQRSLDHRDIATITNGQGQKAMRAFQNQGNIRMSVIPGRNEVNLDIIKMPTKEQLMNLEKITKGKTINADITSSNGYVQGTGEFTSFKDYVNFLKTKLSSEKGGINFGALIGNGKQNAYKMPGKAALPGSLGEMQEQAQISRGQPLLASLDRAMRSGDKNAITNVAKQMLADPKYQEYWGTLPDYVKSSIGSSVAPTMPTITQVQDNIFKMLNSMPKQSALNQGIYNAMSQVKL